MHTGRTSNSGTMKMLKILLSIILLCSIFVVPLADAYAAWLPCYVELDPFEVIMNHAVRTYEQADYKVHVELAEYDPDQPQIKPKKDEWTKATNFTFDSTKTTNVYVRLEVPEYLMNFPEVQFVAETTQGAKFTPDVTCEGRRAHSRNFFDPVRLEIDGPNAPDEITIVAGWAKGHSAVSLTAPAVLKKGSSVVEKKDEL